MSDKAVCPGCDSYTSKVFDVMYRGEGDACPYCGLPLEAMLAVQRAKEKMLEEKLIADYIEAMTTAGKLTKQLEEANRKLAAVREAIQ